MLNRAVVVQRGLRLLRGRTSYREVADRVWTLHPRESSLCEPAIYLDDELDKVTGVMEETTIEHEMARIGGGIRSHGPTVAYRLRDVSLCGSAFYRGAMRHVLSDAKAQLISSGPTTYMSSGVLASTYSGNRYFGHWMTDDITLNLAASRMGEAVTTAKPLYGHQMQYSALFDIRSHALSNAAFEELTIIDDVGQNLYKKERYENMRNKLTQVNSIRKNQDIMLVRGSTGASRCLENEMEIAEFLGSQGFSIVRPEETTPAREIVTRLIGARIVVSVEGSQLVHGLFTVREGGVLLALQPPYRFNNVFKDYADCLGLKYAFVVGKRSNKGFEIGLQDLARTLDLVHSHLS